MPSATLFSIILHFWGHHETSNQRKPKPEARFP